MILALLLSCSSTPESKQDGALTPVQQDIDGSKSSDTEHSLFLTQCAIHTAKRVNDTLDVIFDRLGSANCSKVYKELSTTKTLDLSNHPTPFADISVLTEFTQIEELYLSDSRVSDLSPISGYTQLRKLHAEHCAIQDLRPLSRLSKLEDLLIDYTGVDDLFALKDLTSLKRIGLRNTNIRSLNDLSNLTALTSLEISGTSVVSLEPLSALNSLNIVSLRQTRISDLGPLSEHSELFFLDLKQTQVSDLTPLIGLSKLKVLDIGDSKVTNLDPLVNLSSLIELSVQGINFPAQDCERFTGIIQGCSVENDDRLLKLCNNPDDFVFPTQVSMRSLMQDLKKTDCSKIREGVNGLTTFRSIRPYPDPRIFSFFPKLERLELPVETIWYKYCPEKSTGALKTLCQNKKLSMQKNVVDNRDAFLADCISPQNTAGVTYNVLNAKMGTNSCETLWNKISMVEKLSIQRVDIADVTPLSMLQNLRDLSIDYNDIQDLSPLSKLMDLQILWVDDNHLEDLSPIKDVSLLWLSAGDNNIKDITPLKKSINMRRLWLGGNQITDISALENLTALDKLHLAINQIEDISPLSGLHSLTSLYLGYNNIRNIEPLYNLEGLHILSSGLDYDESPLEMQRWFLQGNPIDGQTCSTENVPSAVTLFCSQYN